ncbi:hypothetical protein J4061_004463 [Salmonella enterica]|nr:hypothetical protein [Salmonella enterica]
MAYHINNDVKKQDALQALYNHGFKWVVIHKGNIVHKTFYEYQAINHKRLMNLWGAVILSTTNPDILNYL